MAGKAINYSTKLASLLIKAKGTQEVAVKAASKKEYTALITSLQKELRTLGFKIRYFPPTRDANGEIVLFSNKKWLLALVVADNLSMYPEFYNKETDYLKEGSKKKSLKLCMPDIKNFMKTIAKDIKANPSEPGMKTVDDKTTRNPKVAAVDAKKKGKTIIKVPDFANSATKARNWIKKTVGGELVKSYASLMGNTAYNDWQSLEIDLTGPQIEKLHSIMKEAGFKSEKSKFVKNAVKYVQGDLDIQISTRMFKTTTGRSKGKQLYLVKCTGKKKAKGTNYFMYD